MDKSCAFIRSITIIKRGPNKKINYRLMSHQLNDKIVIDFPWACMNNVCMTDASANWFKK